MCHDETYPSRDPVGRTGLNGGQGVAGKTGIDMAAVQCLAPHIFILDMDDAGPPIYRVAGSQIQSLIGSNPRGTEFYGYWDSEARTALAPYFCKSAENHLPFRLSWTGLPSKTDAVEFETILIPVTAPEARKKCFVGISLALGDSSIEGVPPGHVQHLQHIAFVRDKIPGAS